MSDKNKPEKHSKLNSPAMKKKTVAIHNFVKQLEKYNSIAVVKIGQMLADIKNDLAEEQGHGEWIKWLEASPVFGVRNAQRAMALAEWSVTHAVYYRKWVDLGPSKLGVLLTLPDSVLKQLADKKIIKIPGSKTPKTLYDMTKFEMLELIKQYIHREPFSIETEVKQAKSQVRKSIRVVGKLMSHANKMETEDLMAVEREITRLLKEVREIRKRREGA